MPTDARTSAPAELGGRSLALLVDGLVVGLLGVLAAGLTAAAGAAPPGPLEIGLLWFVYRAATDAGGGSLGKRLLRLRVVGPSGRQPGLGAGATRNLWGLAALLPAVLPPVVGNGLALATAVAVAISIARVPDERGWHDRMAGTAVRRPA